VSMSDRLRHQDGSPVILGMLSVFALVSSFIGGVDIAMDSTAGERERQSLLPLLLNPVRRSSVVLGKWIAVTVFALASLALNCAGLILVLAWASPATLASHAPRLAAWIAFGLVPLAGLGAACNLLVAAMCRSTKEAHSALRFLAFVPMIVGLFLVFFPAAIGRTWFVLPIAGQQALIGMAGHPVPLGGAAILALVTTAAVAPALAGAVLLLNRDEMLAA
jgi:sodium transport system permease protein